MLGLCIKEEHCPGLSVQAQSALFGSGETSVRAVCTLVDTRKLWSSWRWSRGG